VIKLQPHSSRETISNGQFLNSSEVKHISYTVVWVTTHTFHVHYLTESTTAALCTYLFTFHLKNTKIFVGYITMTC